VKELSRREIVAGVNFDRTAHSTTWPDLVEVVGVVKLFEREGDGGKFYTAFLHENIETVLERAAAEPGAQIVMRFV